MLDSSGAVCDMVRGMSFHQYQQDRRTRRAIEREIEIIGEAARNISDAFKAAHPEIPWVKIMSQRHRIAHEYGEIQDEVLWRVATFHVPELIPQLERLMPEPPKET